jgi:hypothetical protein
MAVGSQACLLPEGLSPQGTVPLFVDQSYARASAQHSREPKYALAVGRAYVFRAELVDHPRVVRMVALAEETRSRI